MDFTGGSGIGRGLEGCWFGSITENHGISYRWDQIEDI